MPAESAGGTAATACSSWWLVGSQWGGTQAEPACHVEADLAVGRHVRPEQRGEAATVLDAEYVLPGRIGQHVLEHQGVDVDQGGLQDPQVGDGELALVAAVGGQLPALAVQDDRLAGVVRLQHVEALTDLPLQVPVAEINEGLNVLESHNPGQSIILYGKGGELATNRRDERELTVACLRVLQAALVYVNTLMLQDVLADPAWEHVLSVEDRRGLTPLSGRTWRPTARSASTWASRLSLRAAPLAFDQPPR